MANNTIYNGMDVLKCAPGSVFRVKTTHKWNNGDIILRVDNQEHPFFTLYRAPIDGRDDKCWWGTALGGYEFEYLGHILDREFAHNILIIK